MSDHNDKHAEGLSGQAIAPVRATSNVDVVELVKSIQGWATELGFSQIGVSDLDVSQAMPGLQAWLQAGHHGTMGYMAKHADLRGDPARLVPGALSAITVRMDYLPTSADDGWREQEWSRLRSHGEAVISVYARGRDYHKVVRGRLRQLAQRIEDAVGPMGHRVFTDSAPVFEVELGTKSGLGWRGKHTLLLSRDAGSMFFLGEVLVDLALPSTEAVTAHCGTCTACLDVCPTQAIVAPYRLDARRCIAYLTIEHEGSIPEPLRRGIGNRVFGCDDCQLVCPWNKHAQRARLPDFEVRQHGHPHALMALWDWDETQFNARTEGTVLRRAGYQRWRRNLAVAMGNALADGDQAALHRAALLAARAQASAMVVEHIDWALLQQPANP